MMLRDDFNETGSKDIHSIYGDEQRYFAHSPEPQPQYHPRGDSVHDILALPQALGFPCN